ncbi:hypothetical protein A2U01_0038076 [Trifolium medium]|uniref:Uncharacterized protein n=1 Tax=Trifolium medium TaxID=97028 RepID=A0A392PZQ2_9FABA|nr:hypothetical protein [Trifolium medium]
MWGWSTPAHVIMFVQDTWKAKPRHAEGGAHGRVELGMLTEELMVELS